jgi:hypothetical protein
MRQVLDSRLTGAQNACYVAFVRVERMACCCSQARDTSGVSRSALVTQPD